MQDSANDSARCSWQNPATRSISGHRRRRASSANPAPARRRGRWYLGLLLAAQVCLHGCSTLAPQPEYADPQVRACADRYQALSREIARAGVRDAAYHRIDGFPYLRSSRFLASFAGQLENGGSEQGREWLAQMNQLANRGLLLEWQQLPPPRADYRQLSAQLARCGDMLVADLSRRPQLFSDIVSRARPRDHYQGWKRWLGLYPLAALPFRRGVIGEHRHIKSLETDYYRTRSEAERHWSIPFTYYTQGAAVTPAEAQALLRAAPSNSLGMPVLTEAQQARLLAAWSPAWRLPAGADNDLVGTLYWTDGGRLAVDTGKPGVYTFVTYGRYAGQTTVQLNYSVWFSQRRPTHRWDLLAGELDGVIWRVHLLPSGRVLAADTIHSCGCWYQLYPATGFSVAPRQRQLYREPVYVGASAHIDFTEAVLLTLQANSHLLIGVDNVAAVAPTAPMRRLSPLPYHQLRALPAADGQWRRSIFAESGLIESSRRGERWLFWPMGVASPGAMRISGTHAIAFIGRRHFDDAGLLDLLQAQNIGHEAQ